MAGIEANAVARIRAGQSRFRCDSFYFESGPLVHSRGQHLLLHLPQRFDGYFGVYRIYELMADSFVCMLEIRDNITTRSVQFRDMNGDGYGDFVREGYGMAGSGEKHYNDVYLYNPRKHGFDEIEGLDLNPHFYPKQGIVTCYYNPPGGWSATKYRLNWNRLELLESVEIDIGGMETRQCVRKIYRYQNAERRLFKQDRACDFPPEYKRYLELAKTAE